MNKKRVAIFFGGMSSEHEVSRRSVESVLRNISDKKYDVVRIGITKDGKWLMYSGPIDKISNGDWENDPQNKVAFISPDRSTSGLIILNDNGSWETINIDVIFPVLHGKNGEDGTIQGLFQLSGIPFVGCDTASSAACMDKVVTNVMLTQNGIKKAKFTSFWKNEFVENREEIISKVEDTLRQYPLFIKPANAGSSVGVTKASDRNELIKAIEVAMQEDSRILVEETIVGREVECAVLGNETAIASEVGEIAPSNDFYDYDAKYLSNTSKLFIPAQIDSKTTDKIRKAALSAYKVMGCSGLSRIDFFLEENTNEVLLNEINTLPGFTSISMYPKLFEAVGISYPELIDRLIDLAVERFENNG